MKILNSENQYGLFSIAFHWAMALIILATFILGKNLEHNYQYYDDVLKFHNSFGILIFILAIFRISWRWMNIKPGATDSKKILMKIATLVHIFFYIIFFILPITGYLLTNLQGDTVSFFNYHLPDILEKNREIKRLFSEVHETIGNVLIIILILHVLGALFHHYILKDNTLKRIISLIKIN